ncbi:MAG: WbqC family protein [Bacteroidales bacterium]|jgi:hypothetical protein|nr:WbqC family protein [Bacteroidales bacterium]
MPKTKSILIPSLIAPPAFIYALFALHDEIIIDCFETYPKQTLRNRYNIGGPNKTQILTIPVKKPNGHSTKTKDIEIDYTTNWIDIHCRSMITAYSKSPFFIYYSDYIFNQFNKRHKLLIDLNMSIHELLMKWLNIAATTKYSENFVTNFDGLNLRDECKKNNDWSVKNDYYQPFQAEFGFRNSLSVFDIIFNLGPETNDFIINESKYANI